MPWGASAPSPRIPEHNGIVKKPKSPSARAGWFLGFLGPGFHKYLSLVAFRHNVFDRGYLPLSGCTLSVPVVSGPGGREPGQKRYSLLAAPAGRAGRPCPHREPTTRWPYLPGRLWGGVLRRLYRRRGARRREEVDAERGRLRAETEREIKALLAEHHAALPRRRASAMGAAYARYPSEFQHSIVDQVRAGRVRRAGLRLKSRGPWPYQMISEDAK
jgi:hypothetical protein